MNEGVVCTKYDKNFNEKNEHARIFCSTIILINKIITIHSRTRNEATCSQTQRSQYSVPKLNAQNFCFATSKIGIHIVFCNLQLFVCFVGWNGCLRAMRHTICRSHITKAKATICSGGPTRFSHSIRNMRIK